MGKPTSEVSVRRRESVTAKLAATRAVLFKPKPPPAVDRPSPPAEKPNPRRALSRRAMAYLQWRRTAVKRNLFTVKPRPRRVTYMDLSKGLRKKLLELKVPATLVCGTDFFELTPDRARALCPRVIVHGDLRYMYPKLSVTHPPPYILKCELTGDHSHWRRAPRS